MNRFFIITNAVRDANGETAKRVKAYLEARGAVCETETLFGNRNTGIRIPEDTEVCITLGGDGTLLEAAHIALEHETPLFGINMGKIGYLTEAGPDTMEEALDRLLQGDVLIESRMMLEGVLSNGHARLALNDITIARYGSVKAVRMQVTVNDIPLYSYNADGVILASPTGSTGYNMSAGGPIVEPTARLMLLTPIAAHTLTARSIVLSPDDTVTVELSDVPEQFVEQAAEISFDAAHTEPFEAGDTITIRRSEKTTNIVRLNRVSFLDVLHRKLG